jgi:hypothetical protein
LPVDVRENGQQEGRGRNDETGANRRNGCACLRRLDPRGRINGASRRRGAGPNALIARVTVSKFQNFQTDIGVDTNAAPASSQGLSNSGTQSPNQVQRNSTGRNVGWDFTLSSNQIAPGKQTVLLVVETNATTVVPGTVSFPDAAVRPFRRTESSIRPALDWREGAKI